MKHILFIMPFGVQRYSIEENEKKSSIQIDFDERYKKFEQKFSKNLKYKKKYKIYRVDQTVGTDIYAKMYKMIYCADVVVADITGLNANVMYELGARHALKHKQTIMYRSHKEITLIPFDINTFMVYDYKIILKKLNEYIDKDVNDDSPILKELKATPILMKNCSNVFASYKNQWDIFKKKYDKLKYNKEKIKLLNKYKKIFDNSESFLQLFALQTYKQNETDINYLREAIKILEPLNPTTSNNYETLGLVCSIYRKMYECEDFEVNRKHSFNASRRFISLFWASYSISSYTMHLLAEGERLYCTFDYIQDEMKRIKSMLDNMDTSIDVEYLKDTKNLVNAMIGKTCNDYDKDRTSTSAKAYHRALALYEKLKKQNKG